MTTKRHKILVRDTPIEIIRKDIKNLHLAVYPPNGKVRVATPIHIDDEAVRLAVISRWAWIKRQQSAFCNQERQSQREMVNGESHFLWGHQYRLDVVEAKGRSSVSIRQNNMLELRVAEGTDRSKREEILNRWLRAEMYKQLPELIEKWQPKVGVEIAECRIKRMKTKWGTCNIGARRIWLNLELAKKPLCCLEYILVHEMVHLLERHHNKTFHHHMSTLMPQWKKYRDELNTAPLAYEDWQY
ncbi:SprT-like family protein [Poriferisphaera corsica]|uniref:SprT-like family protein n=1 Tax=Poriferisphaera corsica TaxID=2528020 RepID=A0A517YPQ4_9BACT|nr:SprT family zinc-dependent metalloprotease [Poriferisphaera corsica]QDU32205.1 SprT-like family protein [Poriferisphaera corsica]